MKRMVFVVALAGLAWTLDREVPRAAAGPQATQGQPAAVPRPFPGSGAGPARPSDPPATSSPSPTTPSAAPISPSAPSEARSSQPDQMPPGAPVYPAAEFIDAFDAGLGQRYYLYGTNAPYADIVAYYKNLLKNGGRELYKVPPMQQFDLGRYDEDSMAYPPSVVVKDYTWNNSTGYLAISGTSEKRFKTIIQIVPVTATR